MQTILSEHPDILSRILTFADPPTRTAAARTCKAWSEPALDLIWHTVPCIAPLLELLGTIDWPDSTYSYARWQNTPDGFSGTVAPGGWIRLRDMAKRIHSLSYHDGYPKGTHKSNMMIDPALFNHIACHRPFQNLFPKLEELSWTCFRDESFDFVYIFLSPTLRKFDFKGHYEYQSLEANRCLLNHLASFSKDLKELVFETRVAATSIETQLIHCIKSLENLESLHLMRCFHTANIVEALGTHPSLKTAMAYDRTYVLPLAVETRQFEFKEGLFTKLEKLSVEATISQAIDLIKHPHRPRNLKHFDLSVLRQPVDPNVLNLFFETVAAEIPNIEGLELDLMFPSTYDGDVGLVWKDTRLSLETIRPLLACKKMKMFDISHPCVMDISEADLKTILESWPEIDYLFLNADPSITDNQPGLPLSAYIAAATMAPKLTYISLYVDTTTNLSAVHPGLLPKFPTLKTIGFGTSPITDVFEAAALISEMCNENTELSYGASAWHISAEGGSESSAQTTRNEKWREVRNLAKNLWKYQARTKDLFEEELLKIRDKTDKAKDRIAELESQAASADRDADSLDESVVVVAVPVPVEVA
ncbi:hypothetical protein FRC02_008489 [Tulasnella sp. 418]|nr:hypothetical protein FRC02_008489 [Tulasnella sp. 418]